MDRRTLLAMPALLTALSAQAQDPLIPISADNARRDLRLLQRALTALHPGLYRYRSAEDIDAEFQAAQAAMAGGASRAQVYLWATRLAAAVRCGHTWTNPSNQSDTLRAEVLERADKLPLTLRLVQGRLLITGSLVPSLVAGAELLAIDGRSITQIIDSLMPYLRADGSSDGKRLAQIDSGPNGGAMDRLFPLLYAPRDGRYTVRVLDRPDATPRDVSATAITPAQRQRVLPMAPQDWAFQVQGDTAVLTLPTFAFWDQRFDAKARLEQHFAQLREQKVPFLIIDLRENEGGDDSIGHALLRQLIRRPCEVPGGPRESAYERVPYNLVRYLDTWDYSFFDRTGQVTRGPGRNFVLSPTPALPLAPVAQPYAGRAIMLVGPQNSSAGYLLARDAKASGAALLLGQATGGNLRGLNGGQLTWMTLPASGVAVDIPLLAHFSNSPQPDAGVTPDVVVEQRFADAAAGVDTEMRAAQAVIDRWRHGAR